MRVDAQRHIQLYNTTLNMVFALLTPVCPDLMGDEIHDGAGCSGDSGDDLSFSPFMMSTVRVTFMELSISGEFRFAYLIDYLTN
jgi:hypothetical protein